ncbi:MAG: DUF368 domain-containing protein [Oscillospiraceae bacterium]|nr:DUF368 domain-containing protein [Oscillospiraceae bacterium]
MAKKTKRFLYRVFCGFVLGLSVFAPGFSGSFLAIVLGIYRDILRIASNPFKQLKANILFCIPLGIGAAASAVLFVLGFNYLFQRFEKATLLLFIGLIAGNLPEIVKQARRCGFKKRYLIGGACAFAAALALAVLAPVSVTAENMQAGLPLLALGGLAGGAAALVPGMSVSMILILLGVYGPLLNAAQSFLQLDFTFLLPFGLFGLCALAGLMLASRGIKAIFDRIPGFANAMVFGFMAGSLGGVLWQALRMADESFTWALGGVMLAAGLGVSMLFVLLGRSMEKLEKAEKAEKNEQQG